MDWSQVMFTDELPFKLYHVPNSNKAIADHTSPVLRTTITPFLADME